MDSIFNSNISESKNGRI